MKPGDSTVELVKEVSDRGADYIVLLCDIQLGSMLLGNTICLTH